MAVLLVIIGAVVATIVPRVISSGKKDFLIEQKRAVRQARNEILGYYKTNCRLPTQSTFENMTHRQDRMTVNILYNHNASSTGTRTIVLANGNTISGVAFWVASLGHNRVGDNGNNYNAHSEITLGFLIPDQDGFDDVVDYATETAVAGLCGVGPDDPDGPGNPSGPIPDTGDYYDGAGLYLGQGNSQNIQHSISMPDRQIKFTRPGTKVPHSSSINAISASFEVDLEIQPNAVLNITVSETVIFKKNISIGAGGRIAVASNSLSAYPISIYLLQDLFNDLEITGTFPAPPQEIVSGGQTYVKIELQSGTLFIHP